MIVFRKAYAERYKRGGRRLSKLSLSDKLAITLGYYREYRTVRNIAFDGGVSKSIVHYSIQGVEEVLAKSKEFALPSKRELVNENAPFVVLMDVTECEIQKPKKKQKKYYSGNKKKHTIKAQVIADVASKDIVCVDIVPGHKHDF